MRDGRNARRAYHERERYERSGEEASHNQLADEGEGAGGVQTTRSAVAFVLMRLIRSMSDPPETTSEPEGLAVAPPNTCTSCCTFATSSAVGGMAWSACISARYAPPDPSAPEFSSVCTFCTIARAAAMVVEAATARESTGAIPTTSAVCAALAWAVAAFMKAVSGGSTVDAVVVATAAVQRFIKLVTLVDAVFAALRMLFHAGSYCAMRFSISGPDDGSVAAVLYTPELVTPKLPGGVVYCRSGED